MVLRHRPATYFVDTSKADPDDRLVIELQGGETLTFRYQIGTPDVTEDRFVAIHDQTSATILDEARAYVDGLPVKQGERKVKIGNLEIAFLASDGNNQINRPQPHVGRQLLLHIREKKNYYFYSRFTPGGRNPRLVKSVKVTRATNN